VAAAPSSGNGKPNADSAVPKEKLVNGQ
jgi:hypothetical protein